jgi:hypothetical protein
MGSSFLKVQFRHQENIGFLGVKEYFFFFHDPRQHAWIPDTWRLT